MVDLSELRLAKNNMVSYIRFILKKMKMKKTMRKKKLQLKRRRLYLKI